MSVGDSKAIGDLIIYETFKIKDLSHVLKFIIFQSILSLGSGCFLF